MVAKSKPSEGTVISAAEQSEGRGQFGSNWESEPGSNLTLSVILYPTFLQPSAQFDLSRAMALGVCDCLREFLPAACIKWPNDLYAFNRKLGGILIQNTLRGSLIESSVVGIGLNVNQTVFRSDAPNPGSLRLATGREWDLGAIRLLLFACLERRYLQLRAGERDILRHDYRGLLFRLHAPCLWQRPDGSTFEGQICDVADNGQLQIAHDGGTEYFDLKAVRMII